MTDLTTTLTFIGSSATENDIARIHDACRARSKMLRSIRSASLSVGDTVELVNISPKYLAGLTGTLTTITKERGDVELDEDSTNALRFARQSRFHIAPDQEHHVIAGVPLSACKATS